MADQKSRGGQKESNEKQASGKKNRDVRPGPKTGPRRERAMAEDARRGRQGNQGGYPGSNRKKAK
ncbi:MAG: hypothetical protein ACJ8FY_09555 [Gemmataceae bacterium]